MQISTILKHSQLLSSVHSFDRMFPIWAYEVYCVASNISFIFKRNVVSKQGQRHS